MRTDEPTRESPAGELLLEEVPVTVFGHEPSRAALRVSVRSRRWRLRRAALPAAATLVVTPLVSLVPPHAPWAVGALVLGVVVTRRRWMEEFTVLAFRGSCPRCGAELDLPAGTRLRFPHPLPCEECRHEPILKLDPDRLRDRVE